MVFQFCITEKCPVSGNTSSISSLWRETQRSPRTEPLPWTSIPAIYKRLLIGVGDGDGDDFRSHFRACLIETLTRYWVQVFGFHAGLDHLAARKLEMGGIPGTLTIKIYSLLSLVRWRTWCLQLQLLCESCWENWDFGGRIKDGMQQNWTAFILLQIKCKGKPVRNHLIRGGVLINAYLQQIEKCKPKEAETETTMKKAWLKHQHNPKERKARVVHCCRFGSKRFQRPSPQNWEKLIEYESTWV